MSIKVPLNHVTHGHTQFLEVLHKSGRKRAIIRHFMGFAIEIHQTVCWLNQWCEYWAGLFVWPANGRQEKALGNLFDNSHLLHISAFTFIFQLILLLLVHNEHILEYYNTGWFRLLYFFITFLRQLIQTDMSSRLHSLDTSHGRISVESVINQGVVFKWKKIQRYWPVVKLLVHPKMEILSVITHTHVVPTLLDLRNTN